MAMIYAVHPPTHLVVDEQAGQQQGQRKDLCTEG